MSIDWKQRSCWRDIPKDLKTMGFAEPKEDKKEEQNNVTAWLLFLFFNSTFWPLVNQEILTNDGRNNVVSVDGQNRLEPCKTHPHVKFELWKSFCWICQSIFSTFWVVLKEICVKGWCWWHPQSRKAKSKFSENFRGWSHGCVELIRAHEGEHMRSLRNTDHTNIEI